MIFANILTKKLKYSLIIWSIRITINIKMVGSNTSDTINTIEYDVYYLLTKIKKYNDLDILYRYLINNPNEIYKKYNNGETILMYIIKNIHQFDSNVLEGLTSVILFELDEDQINEQDKDGKTALMYACDQIINRNGFNIIKLLLKYGADVNIKDNNNEMAIHILAKYRNTKNHNITKASKMLKAYGAY
ncbi:ankyrin repeat protein [Acanthamoeba polyphaga moumouvirus]|uniref:Ankyrin repeat protein n=2 Tax=Moumouvirus TaxID=3080801 RepID=L7RD80_9VIRU|nr:ankyrin repeat protein [Acanthamoeba polyphaga moumouvirus]AEX62426.1 putative ankyrin repeat protein [Moumouvirus Monve]AGC02236.1 ankyrin repeat protein [Acanthamoeba polyphaga moumouvirus]